MVLLRAVDGASIDSRDLLGSYGLGHFDIGARVHFLAEDHRVVPFIQFGLGGRAVVADVITIVRNIRITDRIEAAGAGLAFGGRLNAHFTPSFAFTASFAWSAGDFYDYTVNDIDVPGASVGAVSGRLQLGVIWFPGSP